MMPSFVQASAPVERARMLLRQRMLARYPQGCLPIRTGAWNVSEEARPDHLLCACGLSDGRALRGAEYRHQALPGELSRRADGEDRRRRRGERLDDVAQQP